MHGQVAHDFTFDSQPPPRVLLPCSGLEHAYRGFESFARECFEALRPEAGVQIELVKGSGPSDCAERSIPSLRRDNLLVERLAHLLKARPFRIEALAFGISLQPVLARRKPDVVYLSEWDTARALACIRSVTRQRFKLLLCNGSLVAEGFEHLDKVQDITPAAHEYVLNRGADPARHILLPVGSNIPSKLDLLSDIERRALRRRLGLPEAQTIVVSIAALNFQHKRLDYVVEEVASIPDPRPFLLLVGQPEEETPALRALATRLLGEHGHSIRTVPAAEIADLCRAADAFVLASTFEGLPRVLFEASAVGLPCLVHSYPVTEFALGSYAYAADLRRRGALSQLICNLTADDYSPRLAAERHSYVYKHFSWERLTPRYIEMLRGVAAA